MNQLDLLLVLAKMYWQTLVYDFGRLVSVNVFGKGILNLNLKLRLNWITGSKPTTLNSYNSSLARTRTPVCRNVLVRLTALLHRLGP